MRDRSIDRPAGGGAGSARPGRPAGVGPARGDLRLHGAVPGRVARQGRRSRRARTRSARTSDRPHRLEVRPGRADPGGDRPRGERAAARAASPVVPAPRNRRSPGFVPDGLPPSGPGVVAGRRR
ncbi:hypothetical protein HBB16_08080 [Pseudonocardia sp. MCCB 268]|nr:hypothetical protein [Pseudonocardia cytotoxica]